MEPGRAGIDPPGAGAKPLPSPGGGVRVSGGLDGLSPWVDGGVGDAGDGLPVNRGAEAGGRPPGT
ncbi:MAG: hypothetical protein ACKPGK_10535, partial [Verrucomicrobiota bacterium]